MMVLEQLLNFLFLRIGGFGGGVFCFLIKVPVFKTLTFSDMLLQNFKVCFFS